MPPSWNRGKASTQSSRLAAFHCARCRAVSPGLHLCSPPSPLLHPPLATWPKFPCSHRRHLVQLGILCRAQRAPLLLHTLLHAALPVYLYSARKHWATSAAPSARTSLVCCRCCTPERWHRRDSRRGGSRRTRALPPFAPSRPCSSERERGVGLVRRSMRGKWAERDVGS